MSDKFKNTLANLPEFALGEQPNPLKLNRSFQVIQQALNELEKGIGDIRGAFASNVALSDRPLLVGNLGRFLGPIANFQSVMPAAENFTFQVSLEPNRNEWTLPLWPFDGNACDVSVSTSGAGTIFTNKVNIGQLAQAGDWMYDATRNKVISYNPLTAGTVTISGTSHPNAAFNYRGIGNTWQIGNETLNVMPPFHLTLAGAITVANYSGASDYSHVVTLNPISSADFQFCSPVKDNSLNRDLTTAELQARTAFVEKVELGIDPFPQITSNISQRLPYELTSGAYSAGDEIPSSSVMIYNEPLGKLYDTSRYFYKDSTSFYIKGPALTNSDLHRVVCNGGGDISSAVEGLRFSAKHHRHIGPEAISHFDLTKTGYCPPEVLTPAAVQGNVAYGWHRPTQPSTAPGNPHPQYLMRNGYMHGSDNGNLNNMMLGELALAMKVADATSATAATAWDSPKLESWPILFGGRAQARLGRIQKSIDPLDYDQALFVSGEAGPDVSNHANNIAILTGESSNNLSLMFAATDVIVKNAGHSNYIGDPDPFPVVKSSHLNVGGVSNSLKGNIANSKANCIGTALVSTLHGTNSNIEISGSNFSIVATSLNAVSAEIVGGANFQYPPTGLNATDHIGHSSNFPVAPGTKYIRCKDFYVDADNRTVRRPILIQDLLWRDTGGGNPESMSKGDFHYDDLGFGTNYYYTSKPNAYGASSEFIYFFDLPEDAALSRVRLRVVQVAAPTNTTYTILGFDENGASSSKATNVVAGGNGSALQTVDWNLASGSAGVQVVGDRFPFANNSSASYSLCLKGSNAPTFVSGYYEYKLMRQ